MTLARLVPLLLLLASAAVLAAAWGLQLFDGLQPCELCLDQRWPYYVVTAAALLALLAGRRGVAVALLSLSALAFLAGAGLALYHVGVEHHWIAGPTACTGGGGPAASIEELRRRLLAQQLVQCDQVQWSLFGLSLAGWNAVVSLALALCCLAALRRPEMRSRA
ncbi:MAG TPA: disulfide bond formation protein B [Stellaceae bacterium]|nr:disulfide bond formation protein B [Stellaceae bacterium]